MRGLVIKNTGSWYTAKIDGGAILECKIKGNFRLKSYFRTTNPIAVGDFVELEQDSGASVISDLCERKNFIIRRSSNLSAQAQILAANLDLTALVVTVNYPETSTVFIDRFLSVAEAYEIPACLIFNKIDIFSLEEKEFLNDLATLYNTIGYKTFTVSALDENSLKDLKNYFSEKTVLLSGNSGVGKSTLINSLINSNIKTAQISSFSNKGVHTTTFSEMFELPEGGYIIDTPGIKGFGTVDMKPQEIGHYFKEIFKFSKNCRFANCLHINEPDCAVLKAVENQLISHSRYKSYLSILRDSEQGKYR